MRRLTRKEILSLKDDDLLEFYEDSINIFEQYNTTTSEIKELNNELIKCEIKIALLYIYSIMLLPIIITCINFFLGLFFIQIIRYFTIINNNLYYFILRILLIFIFLMSLIYKLVDKNSKQKRNQKKLQRINNELNPIQQQEQDKIDELKKIENENDYYNATLVFKDPLDLKYIEDLHKLVETSQADSHKEAVIQYNLDEKHKQNIKIESEKIKAYNSLTNSIDSLGAKIDKLNYTHSEKDSKSVSEAANNCSSLLSSLLDYLNK